MGFEAKGLGQVILALILAVVASWAGVIVLLVLTITSPGDHIAEGVLLGWVVLAVVTAAARQVAESSSGAGWKWIVATPALPLILAGIYVVRRTAPLRQRRRLRRWKATAARPPGT